jgi:hypothetical protein
VAVAVVLVPEALALLAREIRVAQEQLLVGLSTLVVLVVALGQLQ